MSDDTGRAPTNVKRYDWERCLKAADAESLTKLVGFVLSTYTNGTNGTNAHPGIENLRRECGVGNERTIRRHLAKLVELGLIERVFHASRAGRGGLADVYELRVPTASTTGLTAPAQRTRESNPVDSGTQPSVPSTNPEDHHSSRLALAHDKSRADEADDEAIIEDVTERLEAWAQMNYGVSLDIGDHRCIEGMFAAGEPVRVIENTVKKRVREWEEVWQPVEPVELAEASGAPF